MSIFTWSLACQTKHFYFLNFNGYSKGRNCQKTQTSRGKKCARKCSINKVVQQNPNLFKGSVSIIHMFVHISRHRTRNISSEVNYQLKNKKNTLKSMDPRLRKRILINQTKIKKRKVSFLECIIPVQLHFCFQFEGNVWSTHL